MSSFNIVSKEVDNRLKEEFNRFNEDIIFTTLVPSPSFRKKLLSFQTNVHNECEWIHFFKRIQTHYGSYIRKKYWERYI